MKFYLARLKRHYPCGNLKFLDYYLKHESLVKARAKVRRRYPNWQLVSLKVVGEALPAC